MKVFARTAIGLSWLLLFSMAWADLAYADDKDFNPLGWDGGTTEIHGSLKVGDMLNTNLVNDYYYNGVAFQSYLVDATLVGRLGNEPGQGYGIDIVHNSPVAPDGAWAKEYFSLAGYELNFATAAYNSNSNLTSDGGTKGYSPYVTQAYVEMGGFSWQPKASVWVGTRFYGGDGIPVSGFNFIDRSGAGFGFEGLLGGSVDVAALTDNSLVTNGYIYGTTNSPGSTTIPLSLQVKVHLADWISLEAVGSYTPNAGTITGSQYDSSSGAELAAVAKLGSFYGLQAGTSAVALQAGYGMFGNDEVSLPTTSPTSAGFSALGSLGSIYTFQNSYSVRAVSYGLVTVGDFDVMPAVWMQYDVQNAVKNADGTKPDPRFTASAVVRPVWRVSKTVSLQTEAGVADKIGGMFGAADDWSGRQLAGIAYKFTLAPTLSLDSGFWGLPQVKFLVSWQAQDPRLGYLGPNNATSGLWFGVQTEAKW